MGLRRDKAGSRKLKEADSFDRMNSPDNHRGALPRKFSGCPLLPSPGADEGREGTAEHAKYANFEQERSEGTESGRRGGGRREEPRKAGWHGWEGKAKTLLTIEMGQEGRGRYELIPVMFHPAWCQRREMNQRQHTNARPDTIP